MAVLSAPLRILGARARALNAAACAANIPALYFFTDPERVPDPCAIAARLPRGTAIVYRHFGAAKRFTEACVLARIARRRGLVLLVGADEKLAKRAGAAGVHLPESAWRDLPALRRRHPRWLISIAAHGRGGLLRAGRVNPNAIVLAPVLPSRSAAAREPIGDRAGAAMARRLKPPVIALGGVTARTRIRPGFAGLAAIDAFLAD